MRHRIVIVLSFLVSVACLSVQAEPACVPKPLTALEDVAAYIKKTGSLPPNFIRKKEARRLGWNPSSGNLHTVAPCKSIGGDRFSNREKKLPGRPGRIWYEADIDYTGGKRGPRRIIFSNDGLIYRTFDHYRTFQLVN